MKSSREDCEAAIVAALEEEGDQQLGRDVHLLVHAAQQIETSAKDCDAAAAKIILQVAAMIGHIADQVDPDNRWHHNAEEPSAITAVAMNPGEVVL